MAAYQVKASKLEERSASRSEQAARARARYVVDRHGLMPVFEQSEEQKRRAKRTGQEQLERSLNKTRVRMRKLDDA